METRSIYWGEGQVRLFLAQKISQHADQRGLLCYG